MSWTAVPSLISFAFCIGLALFVFSRNVKHLANQSFALGMMALAIMEFGHFMVLNSSDLASMLFWKRAALVGECLIPGNWLLFSLIFSRSNYQELVTRWKWLVGLVYLISLTFLAFVGSTQFVWIPSFKLSSDILFLGRVGHYFYSFFLLATVLILVNLESTLRASTTLSRWKIKYTLLGTGAIFAFFIYLSSQHLLFSVIKLDFLPITSMVILISSMMIAFSLIRHRLMDVDIFVSRQIVYRSLTIFVVGAYLLMVGVVTQLMQYLGEQKHLFLSVLFTFLAILALMVFLLSEQVRRKVKFFISRNFYKNKYDYREKWLEFTEGLSSKISLNDLFPAIIELLAKTIWVNHISIWLYDEDKDEFFVAKAMNIGETQIKVKGNSSLIRYFKEKKSPMSLQEIDKDPDLFSIYEENREFFNKMKVSVCLPLMIGQQVIGLLTLSRELTSGAYTYQDYELLKTIASQASSSILIAKLSQELIAAKQMETFHQLSSFVIHDLKNFVYMLSLVVQNASSKLMSNPEFQQDVLKMMSDLVSKMRSLITRLSATPDKLNLEFKEADLNQVVEDTVSQFLMRSYKRVAILKELGQVPRVKIDSEQIQNVLMNLLLNAAEALEGKGSIRVGTFCEESWVVVAVSDNGRGMSREFIETSLFKPFRTTKKNGLGIGLFQCKTIVEAHGGRIEVESEEGKGSTFRVKLPTG